MKTTLLLTTLALLCSACMQAETKVEIKTEAAAKGAMETSTKKDMNRWQVNYVGVKDAAMLISQNPDIFILDVRTPQEYTAGHIDKAVNVNFFDDDFKAQLSNLDKNKPYLIHCKSGNRSTKALAVMESLGFLNVTHMDGGFDAWKQASLPVAG